MIHSRDIFDASKPAGFDGVFDWDFLLPCFEGTKISPMDIDFTVERKGHVLMFETKRPGAPIPLGQKITLSRFWEMGCVTLFHVEVGNDGSIRYAVYPESEYDQSFRIGEKPLKTITQDRFTWFVRRWFCWASNKTPPTLDEWRDSLRAHGEIKKAKKEAA